MGESNELSPRSSKKLRPSFDVEVGVSERERKGDDTDERGGGKGTSEAQPVKIEVQAAAETSPKPPKKTFRAIGQIVLAMQRFKAGLNPTYTYGRQTSSPSPSPSLSSGGPPPVADRGHKSSLLFAPLPDVPHTEE